jgi:hypothetical protein
LLDARPRARYQQGMRLDLARLPNDPVLLQRVVRDLADVLERQKAELAARRWLRRGRRSPSAMPKSRSCSCSFRR